MTFLKGAWASGFQNIILQYVWTMYLLFQKGRNSEVLKGLSLKALFQLSPLDKIPSTLKLSKLCTSLHYQDPIRLRKRLFRFYCEKPIYILSRRTQTSSVHLYSDMKSKLWIGWRPPFHNSSLGTLQERLGSILPTHGCGSILEGR